jgi:polynucleotide 5'-hydroxyl-kinase GRC3/NOL9
MYANLLDVPIEWKDLDLHGISGRVIVIGASDTGKSTFSQYLFQRLINNRGYIGYLDGDPGQSRLGPPTTMTLACSVPGKLDFPPGGKKWQWFVGSVTPHGHMLPMLIGAARLMYAASSHGIETVIYDTTGLIDPLHGGLDLKLAKVDLIQPAIIFAIQHENELDPIIVPLIRSRRVKVIKLKPSAAIRARSQAHRQAYRKAMFARYFQYGGRL